MKLGKRMVSLVAATALVFAGSYVAPSVDAQVSYETKGVSVLTDLVPRDDNIKVGRDGSTPTIESITNVQFDLDCNVDCNWDVLPDSQTSKKEGSDLVTIDSMGHVEIARGAATGTYEIKASGKRIDNDTNTDASCKLTVDGDSTPAQATDIILDKEAVESQVEEDVITVAEDGKSMKVNGTVKNVKLYTIVSPEYLLDTKVNFKTANNNPVQISRDNMDGTLSLLTSLSKTESVMLNATAGKDTANYNIETKINNVDFDAQLNCDNIPAGDKKNNNYIIRMNEDLDFFIEDNEKITLPQRTRDKITWTVAFAGEEPETVSGSVYECPLGVFTFGEDGKHINLKTPIKGTEEYDAYKKAIQDGKKSLTLDASISYYESANTGNTGNKKLPRITLSFIDENNSFSQVGLEFDSVLEKERDYVVKKENLGGKEVDVYYIESDGTYLDFPAMTQPNVLGVRDFEEARTESFHGNNVNYTVTYAFSDVEDSSFGTTEEAIKKYQNNDLVSDEFTAQNLLNTPNRTLKKVGIGYKKVTLSVTGENNAKIGEDAVYYLRFVGDTTSPNIIHEDYDTQEPEREGNAVIHVRQGEADFPVVYTGMKKTDVTRQNPYMEYTFETLKGDKEQVIASAAIDKTTGVLRINGLREGKVKVTASSTVDKSQSDSYILYVNDEYYKPDSIQIDISDAVSKKVMTNDGDVNGRVKNIQLDILVNGTNAGIPKVKWETSDESFATITQDGKLTTLKSTGNDAVTITATSLADPSIKDTLDLKIKDVPATGIRTISEKVEKGKTPVLTSLGENAGSCKAYTSFVLDVSDYIPTNAISATGKITWSSGNEKVATVDPETGKVTTLAEGKVAISATYSSASSDTSTTTFNLTVSGFAEKVTGMEVTPASLTFAYVGLTQALTVNVLGTAKDKSVTYESSNPAVAKVTENGSVSAVSAGKSIITITSVADPTVKKTVPVEVKGQIINNGGGTGNPIPSNGNGSTAVRLSASAAASVIAIGGKTKIQVTGASGTVTYTSSNAGIATVNAAGTVTGKKAGTVTITAKNGSATATVKVKVAKNPVIKLAKKKIKKKKSTKIKIQNKAKGAKVKYTLSKKAKKIVKVSKSGKITGKKKGKASITVKVTQYGKTYKKKLTIKVK